MAVPVPQPPVRVPPYPGGGPHTPGTGGSGGASGGGVYVPSSNGGVLGLQQVALFPCLNTTTGHMQYRTFDTTVPPNDTLFPSGYSWRTEQIKPYLSYTVRGIIWTFTDLGQVSVTWTLTGVDENFDVVSVSASLGVGNAVPTGRIMSTRVDLGPQAMMNQSLSVSRLAGEGPLSVVQVYMFGAADAAPL